MNKVILLVFTTMFLSSCFWQEELPRDEPTKFGYNVLHLEDKSKQLFGKLKENEIEVTYYFAWGCPHCNAFHPYLLKWIKTDPHFKKITFKKTPVSLLPNWVDLSRLYYVAEQKGFLKELDVPIFTALHRKNKPLNEWIEDIAKFATPFAKKVDKNITTDNLIDLMESDEIEDKIIIDNKKVTSLMLHSTPTLVLRFNDEYYYINVANSKQVGGIIKSLNNLIDKFTTK
jgi:predicted DsbA family dithiol-disulfide isomerase